MFVAKESSFSDAIAEKQIFYDSETGYGTDISKLLAKTPEIC